MGVISQMTFHVIFTPPGIAFTLRRTEFQDSWPDTSNLDVPVIVQMNLTRDRPIHPCGDELCHNDILPDYLYMIR
jgi:hypothetical protein